MLRIGLLGLGAIGSDVIAMAENEFADRIEIPAVLVRRPRDPATINRTIDNKRFRYVFLKRN
jgi:predicted dinucleotide-utilizing enzyme